MIGASALILALAPHSFWCCRRNPAAFWRIVTATITAIDLGLAGRARCGQGPGATGFDAAGSAVTAGAMGARDGPFPGRDLFGRALCAGPSPRSAFSAAIDRLWLSRDAGIGRLAADLQGISIWAGTSAVVFAAPFSFSNFLHLDAPRGRPDLAQAGTVPHRCLWQLDHHASIMAALLSPWIGFYSKKSDRDPLLLIGFTWVCTRLCSPPTQATRSRHQRCLAGIVLATVTVLTVPIAH